MSDLVERLRDEADTWDEAKATDIFDMRGMLHEAADKLEAMQAALVFAYENGFRWPERFGINRAALNLNRERG